MRIGIDARELGGRATGVGRYLAGLLHAWSADDRTRAHEFVLYAAEPIGVALDGRRFAARQVPGPTGTWWEQVQMPAVATRDHLDVFFSPGYTVPLFRSVPAVVAIHDVSFAAHPEWFTLREGVRRRWLSRQAGLQARSVITISEFSRRELVERCGIPDDKIHVIPPGITPPIVPADVSPADGRVLYVGSIFSRRRLPLLVQAFRELAASHAGAALDIVGDNRSNPREDVAALVANDGPNGLMRWHAWIGERELGALYGAARAFAFLSEYEGLGLTPLEALAAGVPPLLADTAVARESCGEAALYVPLNDVRAVTRGLERLLYDEAVRGQILSAAPQVLSRYNWPLAARETLTVIERAA